MLSFLLRDDNILARNANIRKIYMQTITWTDFNNDIWITTLEKYVIDKILSCKKRGVNLNGSLYYVFLIFGWFLFLLYFPHLLSSRFLKFFKYFFEKTQSPFKLILTFSFISTLLLSGLNVIKLPTFCHLFEENKLF